MNHEWNLHQTLLKIQWINTRKTKHNQPFSFQLFVHISQPHKSGLSANFPNAGLVRAGWLEHSCNGHNFRMCGRRNSRAREIWINVSFIVTIADMREVFEYTKTRSHIILRTREHGDRQVSTAVLSTKLFSVFELFVFVLGLLNFFS